MHPCLGFWVSTKKSIRWFVVCQTEQSLSMICWIYVFSTHLNSNTSFTLLTLPQGPRQTQKHVLWSSLIATIKLHLWWKYVLTAWSELQYWLANIETFINGLHMSLLQAFFYELPNIVVRNVLKMTVRSFFLSAIKHANNQYLHKN